jgi:hypothetical protein
MLINTSDDPAVSMLSVKVIFFRNFGNYPPKNTASSLIRLHRQVTVLFAPPAGNQDF